MREFSGGERTVAGYLRAEVVDRQRPEVRELLLRTSVLERVSGPLADALAGGSGSERVLQELDDGGAFVTALDVGRSWFRYHPLFASAADGAATGRTRRSSPRFTAPPASGTSGTGTSSGRSATRRPPATGLTRRACSATTCSSLILDGRMAAVRELLAAFPRHAPATDAELALASAMAPRFDGLDDEGAAHRAVAEQTGRDAARGPASPVRAGARRDQAVAGASPWRRRGGVGGLRRRRGGAVRTARRASGRAPACTAATALLNLGIAEVFSSRPAGGCRRLEQALGLARRLRRPYLEMSCLAYLALGAARSGLAVSAVRRTAEQAVAIAAAHGWDSDHDPAAAFAVAAMALVWLGRFAEGARWLDRAREGAGRRPRSRGRGAARRRTGLSAASGRAGSTTRWRRSRRRRTPCGPCRASTR